MDPFFSSVVHVCVCIMYARMDGWIDEWMYVYNYECIHTLCMCVHIRIIMKACTRMCVHTSMNLHGIVL